MPDKKTYGVGAFDRTVTTTPKTFRCKECNRSVTEERYPGPKPTVCQSCLNDPERQRRLARERKRAQRQREGMSRDAVSSRDIASPGSNPPAPSASKEGLKKWSELHGAQHGVLIEVATARNMKKRGQPTHWRFRSLVVEKLLEVVSTGQQFTTYTLTDAGKAVVLSAPDDYESDNGFYPLPRDIKAAKNAIRPPAAPAPAAAPEAETAPVEQVDKRKDKALAAWNELNGRQQHYLNAIYEVDQEQEDYQKWKGATGDWSKTPASEWRWVYYDSKTGGRTALQEKIGRKNIDPGTGSTFSALEERGLIETGGERVEGAFGDFFVTRIKITKEGRAAVRAGKNIRTDRAPAGLLAESTWRALKAAFDAGDEGLKPEGSDRYGGISWLIWSRLQTHPGGDGLIKQRAVNPDHRLHSRDRDYRVFITERGKQIYLQRLELHKKEYPDLYPNFLHGYKTVPTRKQVPVHYELGEERRDVLANIAAGYHYDAESRSGIAKRKIARALVELGLLAQVQHESDHRKTLWRLTDAGLNLVRSDEDLQQRITYIKRYED